MCSVRFCSFVFVCLPSCVHFPPPAHSGGPSHRAGRSVFSAMKLGRNRFHKEDHQRQGTNACPCHRPVPPLRCSRATSLHLTMTKPHPSGGSAPTGSPTIGWRSHLKGAWPPIGWQRSRAMAMVLKKGTFGELRWNPHLSWSRAEQIPQPSGPVYERLLVPSLLPFCFLHREA